MKLKEYLIMYIIVVKINGKKYYSIIKDQLYFNKSNTKLKKVIYKLLKSESKSKCICYIKYC